MEGRTEKRMDGPMDVIGPILLGALGGGVGAVGFAVVGSNVVIGANLVDNPARCFGEYLVQYTFLGALLGTPLGAILGAGAGLLLVVTRRMTGRGLLKRVILPLAAGLAVGFILAAAYWLFLITICNY